MAINKVIYGNDTLIDLTSDTVSANNLLAGETAHDRSGASVQGNVVIPSDYAVYRVLANDADLNNITDSGFYTAKNNNSILNKPSNLNQFGLQVVKTAMTSSGYFIQIIWNPNGTKIYTRYCNNGTWSSWTDMIPDDLSDLSDVDISSPTDGQALLYDNTLSKWINGNIQLTESQVTNLVTDLSNKIGKTKLTNENLSTVTAEGFYYAETNNSCSDRPSGVPSGEAFGLLVIKVDASNFYQIYFRTQAFDYIGKMYKRTKTGSPSSIVGIPWTLMNFNNNSRPINVNGTELLSNSDFTAVNFKNGNNVSISGSGSDITISSSDNSKINWEHNDILGSNNFVVYPYLNPSGHIARNVTFTYSEEGYISLSGSNTSQSSADFTFYDITTSKQVFEGGKKYLINLERTNDLIYGILYFRDSSGENLNLTYHVKYENGDEEDRTINYISLNRSNILHTSAIIEVLDPTVRFYTELRMRIGGGAGPFDPTKDKGRFTVKVADDNNTSWEPYAMTNKSLTDIVGNVPRTAGTYTLQAVRDSDGGLTYSWV